MESFIAIICEHANQAHWIIFLLLMLAGMNVPISEDIMLLGAGAIASTCIPEHSLRLFIWVFFGCWLSAWEAYWLGRLLGPKLYKIRWFSRILTPHRIERLHHYYEKFGIFTFIIGRFCPGGVRNALFMTSGLGKMPFLRFISRDGLACYISSNTLFYIGFTFGENHELLIHYFKRYEIFAFSLLVIIITSAIIVFWHRKSSKNISS